MTKKELKAKIESLWNEGLVASEIANELGIPTRTAANALHEMDLLSGRQITKHWLEESGVGKEWDDTCEKIRRLAGAS